MTLLFDIMKKLISIFISAVIVMASAVSVSAENYAQPFKKGQNGINLMRIPSVITLNDGRIFAAADNRHDHGLDSPQNIDTLIAVSDDGLGGWKYKTVNHFDDCLDGTGSEQSASFIDPAVIQSVQTGRIFLIVDAFAGNTGCTSAQKDTGFTADGHLKLIANCRNSEAYAGDFEDGFAKIYEDGRPTAYSVDREYYLYKDGAPVMIKQINSEKEIPQNVFYSDIYQVVHTSFLWMRYSDDGGETWSCPHILNSMVKKEGEKFLGICPGRGFATRFEGKERIMFNVYTHDSGIEHVSTIYSDDNGETWKRGNDVANTLITGKTSESQTVSMPDGTLRMFSRNKSRFVSSSVSSDGGETWSKSKALTDLDTTRNCMVSFINLNRKIGGKPALACSFSCDKDGRANGVARIGVIEDDGSISWKEKYHINKGFFAYSCLTEMSDGRLALLYEDEPYAISYMVLDVGEDGTLREINGNDCGESFDESGLVFERIIARILSFFGLI